MANFTNAAIQAAGFRRRILPALKCIPKEMLPIAVGSAQHAVEAVAFVIADALRHQAKILPLSACTAGAERRDIKTNLTYLPEMDGINGKFASLAGRLAERRLG